MANLTDYYQIEEMFSEEERMVRDVARRFVDDEFLPCVQKSFREGSFPMELVPRLGQLGFLGMTLPTQYGCAGLNSVAYGLVSQELERGDSGLRSFARWSRPRREVMQSRCEGGA